MAGDPANQLTFHLSGGVGNVDSDLSLGGVRANSHVRNLQYTLAANALAGAKRIFLSGSFASWIDSAVYFRDGNAGGFSSRVTAVDTVGHTIDILDPLPTSAAIGNTVWGYNHNANQQPYKNTTALESAIGFTEYIGLYCTNSGAALANSRFWLEALDPGPVEHEIAQGNVINAVLPTIPNKTTPPDISALLSGGAGRFIPARTFSSSGPPFNFSTGNLGFWLKRIAPPNDVRRPLTRVGVVAEEPGGILSKIILYWSTAGFTPVLSLNHAPTVYLRGGARFKATVVSQETSLRVPNVAVGFSKTAGPGTLQQPPAPGVTDANGEILAHYAAPTDVVEIGNVATIEAQV